MGISSLIRQPTPEELQKLPSRQRNAEKVEQHLTAFSLHLQGLSDRAVQESLGLKHLRSAQHSIKRGEQIAKDLGLDTDRVRLKVAAWFEELTDLTMNQLREQVVDGRITQIVRDDGSKEVRKQRGADPRLVGEAGRGLVRMAQFFGLMDSDSSTSGGDVSTNVVFINPTSDGASWDQQVQTVDVSAMSTESATGQQNALGISEESSKGTEAPGRIASR